MGRFIRYHGFIFHHFGSSFVGLVKLVKLCVINLGMGQATFTKSSNTHSDLTEDEVVGLVAIAANGRAKVTLVLT